MASRQRDAEGMTPLERRFVDEFFRARTVGSEAARRAGYTGDTKTLATTARDLMNRPHIQDAIAVRLKSLSMSSHEVLALEGECARGDMDDFLDEQGRPSIEKARERGVTWLIKSITNTRRSWVQKDGSEVVEEKVKLELYDAQRSRETIMKYHGLLTDIMAYRSLPTNEQELNRRLAEAYERATGRKLLSRAEVKAEEDKEPS